MVNRVALEVRPFDDGRQVVPPDPAGLEVKPGHGLISSQDDECSIKLEVTQAAHRPKKYCGMSTKTSCTVLILLVVAVIAIAVGAGVGASKQSASLTMSPRPTNTTTAVSAPATPDTGGCSDGTTYISSNKAPFKEVCNTDFNIGKKYNTSAADWNIITNVATFHDWMDACALDRSQGLVIANITGTCLSVTWVSRLGGFGSSGFGDCFMKNMTALIRSSNKTAQMMHAVLRVLLGPQSANIIEQESDYALRMCMSLRTTHLRLNVTRSLWNVIWSSVVECFR